MTTLRRFLFLCAAAALLAGLASAQDEPVVKGRAGERLEQWRKVRIMEVLKLDEETSVRFFARYNKHVQAMREIQQGRNALVDQLEAMGRSGASDGEFQQVEAKLVRTDEQVADARASFLEDVKPILTPKQIGAYIVFERNFRKNVNEIIREMTQERIQRRLNR